MKQAIIIGLLLIASVMGLTYNNDDNIVIQDIIQSDGVGADCAVNVSNTSAIVYSAAMSNTGSLYYKDIGTLAAGDYCYAIECNLTTEVFSAGGCFFVANKRINEYLDDGVALTAATESQIDAIEADTSEIQANQSNFVTAVGFATSTQATNILSNQSTIYARLDTVPTVAQIWSQISQSFNVSFTYDSNGFPYIDTYTYTDGSTITETWGVNSSYIITNKTVVLS